MPKATDRPDFAFFRRGSDLSMHSSSFADHLRCTIGKKQRLLDRTAEFFSFGDVPAPQHNFKQVKMVKNGRVAQYDLYSDFQVFGTSMPDVREFEFDVDLDSEDEAVEGSIDQLVSHLEAAVRDYSSMPCFMRRSMLKNFSIYDRLGCPEHFDRTGQIKYHHQPNSKQFVPDHSSINEDSEITPIFGQDDTFGLRQTTRKGREDTAGEEAMASVRRSLFLDYMSD